MTSETTTTEVRTKPKGTWGGSRNVRHGLRMNRNGLTVASLPAHCDEIRRNVQRFRQSLEQAVVAAHGEVDVVAGAAIHSACRWAIHSALAARWLRLEAETMPPDVRLNYSREVARACTERDRAIATLGLACAAARDPWSAIDAPRDANALEAKPEPLVGNSNEGDT